MKIDEIRQVKQTVDADEANEYLAKGYRIIKIFSSKVTTEGSEQVMPMYVLGLAGKME